VAHGVLVETQNSMQALSKAVGPRLTSCSAQLRPVLRKLAALVCLFCFLSAVISISDHRFSSRKSGGDRNCKILKGCLDSEDESRKAPVPPVFSATSALSVPALQVVALVAALEVFPPNSLSLPAKQGRAPPVSTILNF